MKDLSSIVREWNPRVMSNGQVRMKCPFRENHTGPIAATTGLGEASMFLNPDMNAYHCFSCKRSGRLTTLLSRKFDVPYFTAIEYVSLIPSEKKVREEFELDFTWELTAPREFTKRGFSEELLKRFLVGIDEKNNIVIPRYFEDKLVGIKFRKQGNKEFWYSEGYEKQNYLYNYRYDETMKEVFIVEGETDTWRSVGHGYENTFAVDGSYLSPKQAKLLGHIPVWNLAMDSDIAGVRAMHKIYNEYKHEAKIRFIAFPAKESKYFPHEDLHDAGGCTKRELDKAYANPYSYAEFSYLTSGKF